MSTYGFRVYSKTGTTIVDSTDNVWSVARVVTAPAAGATYNLDPVLRYTETRTIIQTSSPDLRAAPPPVSVDTNSAQPTITIGAGAGISTVILLVR